ncbi:dUTP diphosphatase [Desulfovibrio sp. SGI.133]|uniref:dUTP diphosphatase n=1 Tax=Desulfovibrio sp. SGI.133 TaxID=3420560 RepID=UPI003CFD45EF
MQIKFVKTHPDAVIPTRGSAGAAGFDLTAVSLKRAADLYIYDIGIAMEIPAGYFAAIFPRSSIFFTGLELTNCVGVIDSDFRAPISAIFREVPGDQHARRLALHPLFPGKTGLMHPYKPGDRIAQLIIQPCVVPTQKVRQDMEIAYRLPMQLEQVEFVEVPELSQTERGANGYGSTGR